MKQQTRAYLYTFIVILFWSSVATAFKLALRSLEPEQLLAFSSLLATAVLWGYILIFGKWGEIYKYPAIFLVKALGLGVINPFLFYIALFRAYELLPGQIAMSINFSWPMVLSLLAVPLLKQKLSFAGIFSLLLSFSGVVVIAFKGDFGMGLEIDGEGLIYVIISTVLWALFWIMNVKLEMDSIVKLAVGFSAGTVLIFLFIAATGKMIFPDAREWGLILYVSLFEMSLAFIFWLKALSLSRTASQVSILIFLIPFLSLIFLNVILGEKILFSTFAGLLLITAGILLLKFTDKQKA